MDIRQVQLETGEVLRQRDLPTVYFGEGMTTLNGKLYSLTWRNHIGFVWGLDDFKPLGGFTYAGEGWALATDGRRLIMSDGTAQLRIGRGLGCEICKPAVGSILASLHNDLVVAPQLTDIAGPRVHIRPIEGLPLLHVEEPTLSGPGWRGF